MFIINSYLLAVVFCFITMMCWGSWGNTQKLAAKSWRYGLTGFELRKAMKKTVKIGGITAIFR